MNTMNTETKQKRTKKIEPVCIICDEKINKSTRLLIQCPYCNFEACRTCCETYALNETTVKCMNTTCSKEWSRKHIRELFTLVFINGPLKVHREKILFDQERALLPATQSIVEGKIAANKIDKEITNIQIEISKMHRAITDLCIKRNEYLNRTSHIRQRTAFVRACPDEDCRGFLSSQWKCGICDKWTCPECHIIKGYTREEEHTCNENDVATARLLESDTKPCPKCATGIFKIDGCDQMWCTQCHTAFSWRTGAIQTNIHNPHFYEWQRRTGGNAPRNPNEILCGREINHYLYQRFSNILRGRYNKSPNFSDIMKKVDTIIRNAIHLIHVERPEPVNYERRNENLRVQYLMNEITEEHMKILLQRYNKRHYKNQEISDIYTLLNDTVTDILYRFVDFLEKNPPSFEESTETPRPRLPTCGLRNTIVPKETKSFVACENIPPLPTYPIDTSILDEIKTIVNYANECLSDVSHTYSFCNLIIDYSLRLLRGQAANRYIREKQG